MKKLLVYLLFSVLMMAVSTPALAQVPQETGSGASDQYNSTTGDPCAGLSGSELEDCLAGGNDPDVLTCDNYYEYEIPPQDLVDECGPPEDLTCADYYNYEILAANIPEECMEDAPIDVIPEANKSSNQTFDGFTNTLSAIRSGGRNKAEAGEMEVDKPSSQPGPEEPGGSGDVAADVDDPALPSGSGNANEAIAGNSAPKDNDAGGQKAGGERAGSGSKRKNNGKNDVESKNSDDRENSADSKNGAVSKNEASVEDKESTGDGSGDAVAGASNDTVLSDITELPQTSGVSFVLLGVGVLLVVGGLAASRLFR